LLFVPELLAAAGSEGVVFGFAVVFGDAPFGGEEILALEAVEGGVEGALFDGEGSAGDLFDAQEDAVAVKAAEGDGFEDEEVEGALEEFGFPMHLREG
jgi:hypothetical protein